MGPPSDIGTPRREAPRPEHVPDARDPFSKGRRLLHGRPGYFLFDSLAVDASGKVCVATIIDGGITVLDPRGEANPAHVPMPDVLTTNICFGGADLQTAFVTLSSTGRLVSLPWTEPGLALNYLNK